MSRDDRLEHLREENPEALLLDGFEAAYLGNVRRCGEHPLACYSVRRCLDVLVAQGMTLDEADEHFAFNVIGAWMGPNTPVFLFDADDDEV